MGKQMASSVLGDLTLPRKVGNNKIQEVWTKQFEKVIDNYGKGEEHAKYEI